MYVFNIYILYINISKIIQIKNNCTNEEGRIFGLRTYELVYLIRVRLCPFKNSYVYRAGSRLLKYFEKRCKEIGLNFEDDTGQSIAKKPKLNKSDTNENGIENEESFEVLKKR